jgi:Fe-S cluster assembly iron-binding protein IscA
LKTKIPSDLLINIDGIEFFIDELWHARLDGATLDYVNRRFIVLDAR